MNQGTLAGRRPLRRFREVICTVAAACLLVLTWGVLRDSFTGPGGRLALGLLGLGEAASLGVLFLLEARRRRAALGPRWITLAWMSLPIWVCIDVIAASLLRAVG